ncbi:NAD-glutamate dehydrogenase [Rugosimonospora acidiphila]|uniref:NAD-glutamate dehydrogenase n=1 Tax=Rugosimonospora acidiphila TaxID=556531 RepID=A0ABP9RQ23_9ACTN
MDRAATSVDAADQSTGDDTEESTTSEDPTGQGGTGEGTGRSAGTGSTGQTIKYRADRGGAAPGSRVLDDPDAVEDIEETGRTGDGEETEDTELDQPIPDAERLVTEAVALAGDDLDSARLVRRYWRFAPDEELVGLTPAEMLSGARAHRELAEQRVPGELKLRVGDSPDQELTILEIVTDDMPFLVDTVTSALTTRGLSVHLLVHPLVVVRREPLGRLIEVCADVEADDAISGDVVESWMRLSIDRVRGDAARDELRRDVQRVLTDVREAVEDWPRMRSRALAIADELADRSLPVPERDIADSIELMRWLVDEHFTFLGYREYRLAGGSGQEGAGAAGGEAPTLNGMRLQAVLGTGLGILRQDETAPRMLSSMAPEARAKILEKRLLVITKANSRSTVHRSSYLDYIGIKTFDSDGNVVGERRFLGLFSSSAYLGSVRDLPVVRRKVEAALERSGLSERSHSGKDLLAILEDYPRDELFQIRTEELYDTVMGVLRLAGRRALRLFLRQDAYGRFISCLVFMPRDRFTTENRLRIQTILQRELNGVGIDYATRVGESVLARIHFIVRTDPSAPPVDIDAAAIQEQLVEATRNWDDDFRLILELKLGEEQSRDLFPRYAPAFPDAYKDEHNPYEAVQDIAKLELLDEPGELATHIFRKRKDDSNVHFKVFRYGEPMMLSTVLPVLHSLGVRVSDERPYEITRADATIYLYDFGLLLPPQARDLPEIRAHMENAFSSTWRGEAEIDGFNELVVRAGLTWRQVVILRAYAKYLRQAGAVYSQGSMENTLISNPGIAALLVALFETRFSPSLKLSDEDRSLQSKELVTAIGRQLDGVASLDQDRILRSYLTLIQATLRTSFFQRGADGRPKSYVAFKLEPRAIPDLPAPRPRYEIWVYSPRFEGVHLRFGPVARGGLRWSDRRDDFRTEILGLVKAQMVKNAVIVPVGAKGGFVLKQAPADRDGYLAEGVSCYKMFISALLDVTDNLVGGVIVRPRDVVRHDGDDPYLVVAADKGTATFSDTANEISLAYGFWLGDAFASGGSAGYDHKKMGITAKGAWESVKRHFRERGVDTQGQDFTVVGVGDMSGDVFGNGMLLSEHIRLVAAFDHRHIFLDPDPDAATSFAERRRMFDLPRSSWADYDQSLISAGGGVWPRTAKSIPISEQIRRALDLNESVTAMAPNDLMKAILLAPVDLLWNGGIGTYVKASSESHAEVGDKANDAIRVNGAQVRAKVVGEGGNLGLTQRGRVEYATAGGRICTDSIDNSAGVDTSDHEVNIKILLADAALAGPERDALLVETTDEVGELVLRDNYDQATALGNARAQAHSLLPVHRRLISELERDGRLDRALEAMPTDDELAARFAAGNGLTSPEFAVLLSYVKIGLEDEVNSSPLPDEDWTHETLVDYFPTPLRERYEELMPGHALRREIVTTQLVNQTVNRGGITFVYRVVEETGASPADVIRAFSVVRDVFGLPDLWRAVEELDNRVPTEAQTTLHLELRRLIDRGVRWLVTNRRSPLNVTEEVERLRPGVQRLLPELGRLFCGQERASLQARVDRLTGMGIPPALAERAARVIYGFGLMDIVSAADGTGRDLIEVASVYYELSDRFQVDALLSKISLLPRDDRWQTLARMALRYDLYGALAALTSEVLASTDRDQPAAERVTAWEHANSAAIGRARNAMVEFQEANADLAALSVLLRQIRTLVRTAGS